MVWPVLWFSCSCLLLWAVLAWDRPSIIALGFMLGAYILTRGVVVFEFAPVNLWLATVWGLASGASWRQCGNKLRLFHAFLAPLPLCYLAAEFLGSALIFGSAIYVAMDVLAIMAMISAGGYIGRGLRNNRKRAMGGGHYRRAAVDCCRGARAMARGCLVRVVNSLGGDGSLGGRS